MGFNNMIRLPVRILLFAAALVAAFFAVRMDQDIAALLGWEVSGQLFMGIFCGALFAFFLVIFFFRGIGFRAVFVLCIAYAAVIFASHFMDGAAWLEHYAATGEALAGEIKPEVAAGFDETRLLELRQKMRVIGTALLAFTVISFVAFFVPKPKRSSEDGADYEVLETAGKGLWLSSIYACICTAAFVFGGTILLTEQSAPWLFKALFVFREVIGFGDITLRGIGQIMFAIPFIVNSFKKGASLLMNLHLGPDYYIVTTYSDGRQSVSTHNNDGLTALLPIFKCAFFIVFFFVFGIPLTIIKMTAGIFRYDIRYDRIKTKPAFFKTPYLVFFLFIITFLVGMTFDRAPHLFNLERITLTQTENLPPVEIAHIAGTWTDIENRDWIFSADGKLVYDDGPMGIKEYQFTIAGSRLTIPMDRTTQVYTVVLSEDGTTLTLSGGRNMPTWRTAGPGWNNNQLTRK